MRIWALSDLHLGFSTGKWMDRFGEHWKDHASKIEANWRECVREEDIVLSPGDLSWAMKARDAAMELEWLAGLPGRKVLVKGNHDYWWPGSRRKLESLLPPGIHAIKKNALVLDGIPMVGVRGGDFVAPPGGSDLERIDQDLQRERHELLLSIEDLSGIYEGDRAPIALFHYPPFPIGATESAFTRILEDLGCRHCVFGHLHSPSEWNAVYQGEQRGVRYHLVSCDALGFRPVLIEEI